MRCKMYLCMRVSVFSSLFSAFSFGWERRFQEHRRIVENSLALVCIYRWMKKDGKNDLHTTAAVVFIITFFPSGFIIRLFCSCSTLYSVILHFWLDNSTDHFIITMYQAHIRTFDFYAIDVSANYFEILMVKLSIFHMFFFQFLSRFSFEFSLSRIACGYFCLIFLLVFSKIV